MILWIVLGILIAILAVVFIRAAMFKPKAAEPADTSDPGLDGEHVIRSLQGMIRCKTVSGYDFSKIDYSQFEAFRALLKERYPLVHESCTLDMVGNNGLLYCYKGRNPGKEAVLMAHYDVVPVVEADWDKPPFEAIIEDGVLWGRGSIDTKVTLCGVMEAMEHLIAKGFVPEHDIYLSFGGDEESTSIDAPAIVEELRRRGIKPELVLDEGGAVVSNVFPGVKEPCALIGAGEKGLCNIELRAKSSGGHASTPPKATALGDVSRAVASIESHPMRASFPKPTLEMFDILGRRAPFVYRILFGNLWLFSGLLKKVFTKMGGEMNAMCRTTVAFTMASGSNAPNVLPADAVAVANCRVSGIDTVESTVAHFKSHCAAGIEVKVLQGSDPTPYADTKGEPWNKVSRAIHAAYPDAVVAPYVMLACSDSRHFCRICDNVMRFSPLRLTKEERGYIHAANERIPVEKAVDCARFYVRLIEQL